MSRISDPLFDRGALQPDSLVDMAGTLRHIDEALARSTLEKGARRMLRISAEFRGAADTSYRTRLQQKYTDQNLMDFSDAHLKRGVLQQYERDYGSDGNQHKKNGRPAFAPVKIHGALDKETAASFRREIRESVKWLPPFIRKLLAEGGVRTQLARRLTDLPEAERATIEASAKSLLPHLRPAGNYNPAKNLVTVFQQIPDTKPKSYAALSDVIGIYIHECGHAVDFLLGEPSIGSKFSAHFAEDLAGLAGRLKKYPALAAAMKANEFSHFLDQAHGGEHAERAVAQKEAFAELFAENMLGRKMLSRLLPATARHVDRILATLQYEMTLKPPVLVRTAPTAA